MDLHCQDHAFDENFLAIVKISDIKPFARKFFVAILEFCAKWQHIFYFCNNLLTKYSVGQGDRHRRRRHMFASKMLVSGLAY